MMPVVAIRMARAAGLLCAAAALFAFSKDWSRQVPLNTKGGLVLLIIGLAAAAGAHRGSRLTLRVIAVLATRSPHTCSSRSDARACSMVAPQPRCCCSP